MFHSAGRWLICASCMLVWAGCGGAAVDPNRPATAPVSGTVTYQGSPVENATVTFLASAPDGKSAVGRTDASGKFALMTFAPGDGAVPGQYKVMISKQVTEGGVSEEEAYKYIERGENPPEPTVKNLLPEKYTAADTSGLSADVTESGENTFTFELTD